ncbi:transposase [Streptomyces sp. NPDC058394]|uniref:transposase n=1 Tax=Streptomyces sp. NPDC058394 TaxID=3346477 RepID=UPI00365B68A8
MAERQNRPFDDGRFPRVLVDAVHVRIRDHVRIGDGAVPNRPIHVAVAVTTESRRGILGLYVGDGGEGAQRWPRIFTEIENHSVKGC